MSLFEFDQEMPQNILELVEQYESAVRNNRSAFFDQDDFESLIEYYQERGALEKALIVVEQSLEQYPFSALLLLKKAQIFFEMKMCVEALDILEKAEAFDSSELGIALLKAEIFTFQSRYKEAILLLESLVDNADTEDIPDIYLQLADVYEDWEKYTDVYEALVKCVEADSENEEALNRLNYCAEITEKFEDSITLHEAILEDHPYNVFAWYNLGCAYRGIGRYEKAIDAFEYVVAIQEDADYAYQDIAELYFKLGLFENALEALKDFQSVFEPDEEVFFLQGQCYEALGNMKMARYHYKKAAHENPSFSAAFYRIGETYKQEGLWEQAMKAFQKASELEKQQYDFLIALAEAALNMDAIESGMDAAEAAMDIAISRHEAYWVMAQLLAQSGDIETATEIVEKGMEMCKQTTVLEYACCALKFKGNQLKEAEQLLRKLLILHAEHKDLLFQFDESLSESVVLQRILAEVLG